MDQFLAQWLIKSLFPSIIEDVAKGGVMTEEKVIAHAKYLDLIYIQSTMLYKKIPDSQRPSNIIPSIPGK